MKKLIGIIAILCITGLSVPLAEAGGNAAGLEGDSVEDPLNATYLIEGKSIRLIDGRCEISAVPGSATKIITTVAVKTGYLALRNEKLPGTTASYKEGQVFEGRVRIGHEVRSFEPCIRKEALWLAGKSPALAEIIAAYRRTLPRAKPYQPLFMVLAGKWVVPPADGFGAEYEAAFMATQLVRVVPEGDCTEENSLFGSPTGFSPKITFDLTRLDDNGLLGTLDAKRALAYEFCIPATVQYKDEVEHIDSTVQFMAESPGRIGCGKDEFLCIGSTHQKNFRKVLMQLAILPYVQRIDEAFFE